MKHIHFLFIIFIKFIHIIIWVIIIKPIIGIISRDYYSDSKRKINIVYNDIISSVLKSGGIPIGIPYNIEIEDYLDICNGFILQGGDNINEINLRNLEIIRKENIPTLGICLGMQEMFYDNNMIDIKDHNKNELHEINIDTNTLLYKIINKDKILVNSRHKSSITNTKEKICAISLDNAIEAIEISNLKFYLGLQWHPENLYDIDNNSKKIFDYFIKICCN